MEIDIINKIKERNSPRNIIREAKDSPVTVDNVSKIEDDEIDSFKMDKIQSSQDWVNYRAKQQSKKLSPRERINYDILDKSSMGQFRKQTSTIVNEKRVRDMNVQVSDIRPKINKIKALQSELKTITDKYPKDNTGKTIISDNRDLGKIEYIQEELEELEPSRQKALDLNKESRVLQRDIDFLNTTVNTRRDLVAGRLNELQSQSKSLTALREQGQDVGNQYETLQEQYEKNINMLRSDLNKKEFDFTPETLDTVDTESLVYGNNSQLENVQDDIGKDYFKRANRSGIPGKISKVAMPLIDPFIPKNRKAEGLVIGGLVGADIVSVGTTKGLTGPVMGSLIGRRAMRTGIGVAIPPAVGKITELSLPSEQKLALDGIENIPEARAVGLSNEKKSIRDNSYFGREFISELPSGRAIVGNTEAYRQGVEEYYINQGYSPERAELVSEGISRMSRNRNIAELPSILYGAETNSELLGRGLMKNLPSVAGKTPRQAFIQTGTKSVPALVSGGITEGVSTELIMASSEGRSPDIQNIAVYGSVGAVTAPVIGGTIAGFAGAKSVSSGTKKTLTGKAGKWTQFGANLYDLPEYPGDKLADFLVWSGGRLRPSKRAPVFTVTPSQQTTFEQNTPTSFNSVIETSASISSNVPTYNNVQINTPISQNVNTFTDVPETFTTRSNINLPSSTTSPINANVPNNVPSIANANVQTTSNVQTNLQVPTVVPFEEDGFIPLIPLFGLGNKSKTKKKKKKNRTKYTPSFDAIALGITAKKGFKKKKLYTGIETRPIIG